MKPKFKGQSLCLSPVTLQKVAWESTQWGRSASHSSAGWWSCLTRRAHLTERENSLDGLDKPFNALTSACRICWAACRLWQTCFILKQMTDHKIHRVKKIEKAKVFFPIKINCFLFCFFKSHKTRGCSFLTEVNILFTFVINESLFYLKKY